MKRRIPIIATIGAIIGIFLLLQNPVNAKLLRLEFIGAIVVAWIGLAWIFWKWKKFRFLWIVIPLILIIPFLLLGRQIDPDILRETYLRRLITFNGTRYYWGGKAVAELIALAYLERHYVMLFFPMDCITLTDPP